MISKSIDIDAAWRCSRQVAERLGWTVELEPRGPSDWRQLKHGLRTVDIKLASDRAAIARTAGRSCSRPGPSSASTASRESGLDHVVFASPFDWRHPSTGATRSTAHPFDSSHPSGGDSRPRRQLRRRGQRWPAAGRVRRPAASPVHRRGDDHAAAPWSPSSTPAAASTLARRRRREGRRARRRADRLPRAPPPTPRLHGDLAGPLDGVIDPLSGHGTFIAGLVHQACPDADIVSWRIVPSGGPDRRVRLGRRPPPDRRAGRRGTAREKPAASDRRAEPVDGLLPRDAGGRCSSTRPSTTSSRLSLRATLVVCSAGNDATSRPNFPAAFAPWSDGNGRSSRPRLPADRLGRRAQPERQDRRAVQQRRAVGARLRAGRRGDEHRSHHFQGGSQPVARYHGVRPGARGHRPRRLPRRLRGVERHVVRGSAHGWPSLAPTAAGRARCR